MRRSDNQAARARDQMSSPTVSTVAAQPGREHGESGQMEEASDEDDGASQGDQQAGRLKDSIHRGGHGDARW